VLHAVCMMALFASQGCDVISRDTMWLSNLAFSVFAFMRLAFILFMQAVHLLETQCPDAHHVTLAMTREAWPCTVESI
jgi:hypothetical protein